jgi:adenine-specific DNA methylase
VNLGYIKAQTHGPEYSWHKYWSRKPANVVSAYLQNLVPPAGLVVDPFCGSGVVLYESKKLGLNAIGIDVNPTARAISSFLTNPVNADEFRKQALKLLTDLEAKYGSKYLTKDGHQIRYLIHHVQVKCDECNTINTFNYESHGKNGKKCEKCGNKLSFGLINLFDTEIAEVVCVDSIKTLALGELHRQKALSSEVFADISRFNKNLVNNKRTLTSSKFGVGSYFTPRNFSILSEFAQNAHEVRDESMRKALLLVLTATSAQASRLIASRGGLKTGGQAWTIPGFWIPPVHLESNPFIHLKARIEKLYAALKYSEAKTYAASSIDVVASTARVALQELVEKNAQVDLVFLDPPYGDSVAFLEFSAIWNAFMDEEVSYGQDISVSDRSDDPMNAEKYLEELTHVFKLVSKVLKPEGKALLTFNNTSLQAWKGIIESFQIAGLVPLEVNYQDPAVISSKSQKAIGGSYVGDFYVIYGKDPSTPSRFNDFEDPLLNYLNKVVGARGGSVLYPMLQRYALEFWLENNLEASELYKIDELISSNFTKDGNQVLSNSTREYPSLLQLFLTEIENSGKSQLSIDDEFLIQVKLLMREFGTPSLIEIRAMLKLLLESKAIASESNIQLSFDFN